MIGVGRVERYVVLRAFAGVGAALAILSAVLLLVQFASLAGDIPASADVTVGQLFTLTLLKAPSVIQLALPFVFLFGGIGAYVALNRSSQLVAFRAAGVSAWRFILPFAAAAFLAGVLTVAVLNPVGASMNAEFEAMKHRLTANYLGDAPADVWLRQGDERTQIVIHAKTRDTVAGSVRLRGVTLFIYQKNPKTGAPEFRRRLEAAEARLMPGFWQLTNVREATAGETSVRSDSLSIRSTLDSAGAMERFASPEAIAFWKLPGAIRATEQAGFSAAGYKLRFHQLLATPVLFAAMAVLAAAFSLRLARLGGLAGLAGAGVALGFIMYFFNQFSGALARADILPLFAAAWAPSLVALLSGLTLLCYTEDG